MMELLCVKDLSVLGTLRIERAWLEDCDVMMLLVDSLNIILIYGNNRRFSTVYRRPRKMGIVSNYLNRLALANWRSFIQTN